MVKQCVEESLVDAADAFGVDEGEEGGGVDEGAAE